MCKVLPLSMVDTARAPTRSNAQHSGSHVHWCLPLLQQPRVLQANVPFSASGVLLLIMVDNSLSSSQPICGQFSGRSVALNSY